MSWRVVVLSRSAKADYKMDYLIVRTPEAVSRVHISEISVLIIESTAVSITSYLLCELIKHKVKIIFCDHMRNPCAELQPCYGSHDASDKLRQQIQWSNQAKQNVWTEIIRRKLYEQSALLSRLGLPQYALLDKYSDELLPGDSTNREGHAAKVYFNALWGKDFSRSQDNAVNAALNYGYSLLLSAFNREIAAAGYTTQLGISHNNTFNHFNLSCDFMEPLRPLIDAKVAKMAPIQFEREEKMQLVELLNNTVIIDGQRQYLLLAIRIYCAGLLKALQKNKLSEIKWINYASIPKEKHPADIGSESGEAEK